jgi:CRP/FNR family transcriptional regulator, cyclic AMP receptor protein
VTKPIARVAITQSELFSAWPADAVARLVAEADVVRCDDGAPLHRAGDPPRYLYMIAAGGLRLTRPSLKGRKSTTWPQFPGEYHGLGPVISDTPHPDHASCKGQTQLVRIPGGLLRELLRRDGRLALAVFASFYRRYRHAAHLYETASTHAVRARIAALLQSVLARSRRVRAIDLSQDEIAAMLGTRRQVVNRELRAIAAAGAVRLDYGRITVLDPKILNQLALGG